MTYTGLFKIALVYLFLFFGYSSGFAQGKNVKLVHADKIAFNKRIVDGQRLLGNVQLNFDGTQFYCDSAYFFSNENFQAFGRIRVIKPGDYTITGKRLFFDKAKQVATLSDNCEFTDNGTVLTAPNLYYYFKSETAKYAGGGKIVSTKNNNVITSQNGRFHSPSNTFTFRKKVTVKNDDYTVVSDSMLYNANSETSYFFGPTKITGDSLEITCQKGFFNSKTEDCEFTKSATIKSENKTLMGDSVVYNGNSKWGEAFGHVVLIDDEEATRIFGMYGKHNDNSEESLVTGFPHLEKILENKDTLFLSADTLLSEKTKDETSHILAYHQVKLFSKDIQSVCDSLVITEADSLISLYHNPLLWNGSNQLSGNEIQIKLKNGNLHELYVPANTFITGEVKPGYFNQIKGKKLTGTFIENDLRKVLIEGNGELVYFPTETKNGKEKITGQNNTTCSNISIELKDSKIQKVGLLEEPDSFYFGTKKIDKTKRLDGFSWKPERRPLSKSDILSR